MANYMAEVAKLLGVEMNKDFECEESSCTYRITEHGFMCNGCYGADSLMMLLCGERTIRRRPWKPNVADVFWHVDYCGNVQHKQWVSWDYFNFYKIGNCYRTREEAEANRDKWISFYESDEVLEV